MLVREMLRVTGLRTALLAGMLLPLGAVTTPARQSIGIPGSPDATTTIDGHVLPPPPQRFTGQIELTAAQSRPAWPAGVVPPKDAPNILLIMTDDVGFAAPSTLRGVIPTPTLDRIANEGLRYTNGFATLAYNNVSGIGRPGTGTFKVDGKVVATHTMEWTIPLTLPWDETFDIGSDTGTLVDDHDYKVPFAFNGKIDKLTITVERPKLSPEDVQKLEAAYRAGQDAN